MSGERAEIEQEVRDVGRRWAEAELRGDAEAMAPLLADDFVLVGPLGFVLTRDQYLGSRRSGDLVHESLEWEDAGVRVYESAAVGVGAQTHRATFQGQEASGQFRVTQILARPDGRWVLVGLHYSPIAPAAEGAR